MANKVNFFYGNGDDRELARVVYDVLRQGEVCSYEDFMKAHYEDLWDSERQPSSYPEYDALKKAVSRVVGEIEDVMGKESIIRMGSTRDRSFQYVGKNPDPLRLLRESLPKNVGAYLEFCRDSAGFIPEEWVLHFLKNSIALHDIHWDKERGTNGVVMSHSHDLKNLELLPEIYEAIKNKTALRIEYASFDGVSREVWLSPHYLREFNGRWYVSGFKGRKGTTPYNLALDRITSFEHVEGQYREAPMHLYQDWFKDMVGIARYEGATVEDVVIRTKSEYMHGLVMTKPFHHSQTEIKPYGEYEDGTYGEISLKVVINTEERNKEFRGKLLTFGSELEVMTPTSFREELATEARKLWQVYSQ